MTTLELEDIQGLVARGYSSLRAATYLLVGIDDPALARSWLATLVGEITPATARPTAVAVNLALTASGFAKLGLPAQVLALFSNELTAGMTTPHGQRALGDQHESAPSAWQWGGPETPVVDLLILLFAQDDATLLTHADRVIDGFSGVSLIHRLDAVTDLDGREHFGFVDGISQPTVAGLSSRVDTPANTIQPGEVVLGYPNEYGRYTDRPTLPPTADPEGLLPLDPAGTGRPDFGRNGTYLVFRQLSQDVHGFWRFLEHATRDVHGTSNREAETRLASRMVGRWPGGAPLTLSPDRDNPALANENDFAYYHADAEGLQCPIGAHIRRAHPRDSLDPEPGTERSVAVDKRHRLLRRGREYGPPVADPHSAPPEDDADRGIYFICLCGNIARQFEFVQHTWLNNPKFGQLYEDRDPLVAHHDREGATFTVPADPVRVRYSGMPSFVTVRGGGYFFLPGLRALKYLANLS